MNPPTPSETRNPTPDLSQQLPGNAASLQLAATLQLAQLLSQNNSMSQAAPLMLPQATSLQTMQSLLPLLGLQVNGNGNSGASSSAPVPQDRPVGMYQSDEEVLVHALKEADGKGLSYKQALEGLHGVPSFLVASDMDTRVVDGIIDKRTPRPPMEGLLSGACSQNK